MLQCLKKVLGRRDIPKSFSLTSQWHRLQASMNDANYINICLQLPASHSASRPQPGTGIHWQDASCSDRSGAAQRCNEHMTPTMFRGTAAHF